MLRALSRDIDEPARYGGEELTVITPETDAAGAAQLAERMGRPSRHCAYLDWMARGT